MVYIINCNKTIFFKLTGNSVRDDSLCSSSTQKQSIADSSTLIRKQSSIRYTSKYENIEIIPYTRNERCKSCELVQNDEHSQTSTSQIKVYYNKKNGLQITETDNIPKKSAFKTKILKLFNSDFNKSKFTSNNKINFEINIDVNDHPDQSIIGPIRNSSLKDVDRTALKDELSVYMEELKMREKGWELEKWVSMMEFQSNSKCQFLNCKNNVYWLSLKVFKIMKKKKLWYYKNL